MVDGDEISAKLEKKERIEMSKDVFSLNDDIEEDKREQTTPYLTTVRAYRAFSIIEEINAVEGSICKHVGLTIGVINIFFISYHAQSH